MRTPQSFFAAMALRSLALLGPLCVVTGAFLLPGTASLIGLPVIGRHAEAQASPVAVGWVTAYGLTREHGLPAARYRVNGDDFWLYEMRTATDLENVQRLKRGDVDLPAPATGPVTMDRVSVLRFDGETRLLKAIYLR
jgi:hypothetical protein